MPYPDNMAFITPSKSSPYAVGGSEIRNDLAWRDLDFVNAMQDGLKKLKALCEKEHRKAPCENYEGKPLYADQDLPIMLDELREYIGMDSDRICRELDV